MKRAILSAAIFCCGVAHAVAGTREHFLSQGPSAKAAAVGDVCAAATDPSSAYYAPSLLPQAGAGALLEYARPMTDVTRSELALSQNLKRGTAALYWKQEHLPFSTQKDAFALAYGASLPGVLPLQAGILGGLVRQSIAGYSGSAQFLTPSFSYAKKWNRRRLNISAALREAYFSGIEMRGGGERERWDPAFDVSAAFQTQRLGLYLGARPSTNLAAMGGISWKMASALELRAGYHHDPRLGLGLSMARLELDYTVQLGALAQAHAVSLTYYWNKS